jgi:hypothetical protein
MALQKRHIEHIQIWQASGLTQAVYCQQQGLNAKTFSRWFKTYQLSNQSTKPLLIPVEIKPAADTLPTIEPIWLRLSKGYSLELPSNISPRWLAELLQCLG